MHCLFFTDRRVSNAAQAEGADRARFAVGRLQVHQQARAGIDLDDGAALFVERA